MKQILQNLKDGLTTVVDVPTPIVRPNSVLIKTDTSLVSSGTERMIAEFAEKGLLGKARSRPDLVHQVLDKVRREGLISTLEAAFNRLDQPMVLGYSSAGTIIELGTNISRFKVGERVACSGSGYAVHADYAVVPENLITLLPSNVDFESGAFTTVGAIALHGFRLASPQIGEKVAVIGLGLLGILAVKIAQAAGCSVFGTDINPGRVAFGQKMGADCVLRDNAEQRGAAFTNNQGFDIVLICADTNSNDPIDLAGKLSRDRGKVVAIGAVNLDIPRKTYYQKEIGFVVSRSYGPGRYDSQYEEKGIDYPYGYVRWTEGRNFEAFVELLSEKKIDLHPLITHRFNIENGEEAYRLIKNKTDEPYLGILIQYPHQPSQEQKLRVQISNQNQSIHRTDDQIRLGVFGAGNFANATFLPAISQEKNTGLIGIASASGVNARHTAKKYHFDYACSDVSQILSNPEINTVAILTRHHQHASQVIEALNNNKHVFCEKPLAINEEELAEVFDLMYQKPEYKLTVGFNRRCSPSALKIKAHLDQIHEPKYIHYRINAGYIPSNHWVQNIEEGAGRIIGEVCHFIDLITHFIGDAPIEIAADALPDANKYNEDNVILTLNYPDGSIGTVSYLANGSKRFPKEYVEIFSAGSVITLDDFRQVNFFSEHKKIQHRFRLKQDKGHKAFWNTFVECILSDQPVPVSYKELWSVTQSTYLAKKSIKTKKRYKIPPVPTTVEI